MITLHKSLIIPLLCGLVSTLPAVTVDTNGIKNKGIFSIEFPGTSKAYYGRENIIHSISKQEYITSGFRVEEINIVTSGSALLRIYHSRMLQPGELELAMMDGIAAASPTGSSPNTQLPAGVQALANRINDITDSVTSDAVLKEYPRATHARTIEFRVQTREELIALFDELQKHWLQEPTYYEAGQIVTEDEATSKEMKPRNLGGTRFIVQ